MSSTPPTPGGLRPITVTLTGGPFDEPIGSCAARLVLTAPGQATDPAAWAITHALGTPAGGTHTEVAFLGDTAEHPARVLDEVVRQVGNALYARLWAFLYLPELVPDRVLRHGSILRERVEVTAVEVWS
jgi:hypothetical protein